MRRFVRDRGSIASSGVLIAIVAAVIAAALAAEGYKTPELDLHDAGVWISWSDDGQIGRTNTQIGQVDVKVGDLGSSFDLLQSDEHVLVHQPGALLEIDARTALASGQPVALPEGAQVGLGGPSNGVAPTVAILGQTGALWTAPAGEVAGLTLVTDDPESEPVDSVAQLDGATNMVVGSDGIARVYLPGDGDVVGIDGGGQEVERAPIGRLDESHDLSMTAVGSEPVLLDTDDGRLLLPSAEEVDLSEHGSNPRLQQPGPPNDVVYVATDTSFLAVDLGDGSLTSYSTAGSGGAAKPVFVAGCAWFAWSGSPTYGSKCLGRDEARTGPLDAMTSGKPLVFRTNRGKVVINELETGKAYLLGEGEPDEVSWRFAQEPEEEDPDSDEDTVKEDTTTDDPVPPVAVDDTGEEGFATRPDRTVVVDPLRNDSDKNGDVLVIEDIASVAPGAAVVEIVNGGLAVQVTPAPGSDTPVTFSYTINDGTGLRDDANGEVVIRDPSENNAPECDRGEPQETYVRAGASVTHNVLAVAQDPDGDQLRLVVPIELDSALGTVRADQDGTVVYQPPGTGFAGPVTINYRIVDEFDQAEDCVLTVEVGAENARNEPPTARNDHAVTVVGREVVVDVLANDSDPDGDTLRVVGIDQYPGATIEIDAQQRVHVTPTAPGTLNLQYSISDGPNPTVTGLLRVDVFADDGQHPPIAVRDDVILRPTVPAVVDVLANDTDLDGDVLVVTRVTVADDVALAVEVIDRQYLRISPSNGGLLAQTQQFTYTITDGLSEATGTVVVRPGSTTSLDQPPDAVDDEASVRAGTIAALAILENDSDPEGGRLTVSYSDDEQAPPARGLAFAQGDYLRFIAPETPGTFTLTYRASDPAGNTDSATVTIHVLPEDVANNAPDAPDLIARGVSGRPVTIEIPTATMDPDGDSVTLLGIGDENPKHGSVTTVGADRLTYLPDRYDLDADGVPDGFFGTDTFTYEVRDAEGAYAFGTIRVGVGPPATQNTRPVAIDDSRRVGEGGTLIVDVTRNDSDPDDDDPFLDAEAGLGLPADAAFSAEIRDGKVHFDAGRLVEGDQASITYTVTDGILTDSAVLRVTITAEGNLPPIAVDDTYETTIAGKVINVEVLDNDFDPDGERDDLHVIEVSAVGQPSSDGRTVQLTMPNEPVEVTYVVKDAAGATARAVLRIPVADDVRRQPIAVYDEATIGEGDTATVDVLENDIAFGPGNPDKRLFDVVDARNGRCSVSGDEVTFTPDPRFVGLGGCSYLMGDGPGDDPETLRATGMFGVTVERSGNTPPTFVEQPLTLQADSELTRDMKFAAFDPDDGDLQRLTYSDIEGETDVVSASFDGSLLTLRSRANAKEGDQVRLTFTVADPSGGSTQGVVIVTLKRFTGGLAAPLPDRYETFQDVTTEPLDVLSNDQLAESGDALEIVAVSDVTGGTLTHDRTSIVFDPDPDFFGETTFTYTVDDGTGHTDRQVPGSVTVNVIGRPDRPPAPAVVRESAAITLSWGVPSPNGAPITEYRVKAEGGPVSGERVRTTSSNTLRFDGLTNGADYTFQIAAVNVAVTEGLASGAIADYEYSPSSEVIRPNEKPNTPNAPLASYTPADTGGQTLTVSWTDPGGDGTAVTDYVLEISPPPASGPAQQPFPAAGSSMEHQIDGLENGVPYTFRVKAFNTIQGDVRGDSGWSGQSNPEIPATQPSQPLQPQIDEEGDNYIVVGWEEPPTNGDPVSAYVVEYSRNGSVVGETPRLPAAPRTVRIDTDNGASFTFRVKAENKAGFSPWSPASQVAVSYGVPGPTTQVNASEGDGQSVLTVPGMPNDNGRGISSWQYRQAVNGASFPGDSNAGWASFGGPGSGVPANNGTSYQFQVRACNARGCAADPGATSNTAVPYGVPIAPSVNGAVSGTSINWSWSSNGDNGRPITNWRYRWNDGTGWTGWTTVGVATTSRTTNHGYSQTVTFQVLAVNLRGDGDVGTSAPRTTVGPPTQNVVTNIGTCPENEFVFPARYSAGPPPTCQGGFIPGGTALTIDCWLNPGPGWSVDGDPYWYRMTNGPRPGWYVAGSTINGENRASLNSC